MPNKTRLGHGGQCGSGLRTTGLKGSLGFFESSSVNFLANISLPVKRHNRLTVEPISHVLPLSGLEEGCGLTIWPQSAWLYSRSKKSFVQMLTVNMHQCCIGAYTSPSDRFITGKETISDNGTRTASQNNKKK